MEEPDRLCTACTEAITRTRTSRTGWYLDQRTALGKTLTATGTLRGALSGGSDEQNTHST